MKILLLFSMVLASTILQGQGIRGLVTDENGEPLPFASIYIKEKGTGTTSNINGRYELRLPPGSYEVTWQFVGFTAEVKQVKIGNDFIIMDVSLQPQTEELREVAVTGSKEDPAYSIMRKAIAKAPYHLVQADAYSAIVYMKGTGGLEKIPGLFANMAAEDGVDTSRVFTSESVSEISFERPATFREKVISVRTSGEELQGANPNAYVNTSFYMPMVVGAVSPFSPKAFSYYRFRYLGNFEDRGHKIHKIEVTPRSKGDKVFQGTLFVRDQFWNIHSLELRTKVDLFDVEVTQFFAPIKGEIWMPVTQKYRFSASFMGFAGSYQYLASVSNYDISINEDLNSDVMLVDEKIEEPPKEIQSIEKGEVEEGLKEVFEEEKGVSRKQFRKLLKEYEKSEREEKGEEDVLYDRTYEIDSTAAKKDSAYWANIRPVPLTAKEEEGYRKDDSTYAVEMGDSSRSEHYGGFQVGDIFMGGRYVLADRHLLRFPGLLPRLRFNTVEGFNFDLTGSLTLNLDTNLAFTVSPIFRYGFSSEEFYPMLGMGLKSGPREQQTEWMLEGGHFIRQFHEGAIHPLVNSLYSLFLQRNYMKLYEKDFVSLGYSRDFRYRFQVGLSAEWASRKSLFNSTDYSFFDPERIEYKTNVPGNIENPEVLFSNSKAFTTHLSMRWKPWLKYRRYNGKLHPIENTSPEFRVDFNSGWKGILGSETEFHRLEVGFNDEWSLGVRATVDLDLAAGAFLSNDQMLFPDYKHFDGGLTEFAPLSLTGNYRLLDYYLYSTNDQYVSALSHIRFRKFLFTHIPTVRLMGVKENLFINYLKTANSPHYTEVGYGIDNIFRLFRIELVQSFIGTQPESFGVRIGVASFLGRRN